MKKSEQKEKGVKWGCYIICSGQSGTGVTVGQRRELAMRSPEGRAFHGEGTMCPQAQGGSAPAWSRSSKVAGVSGGA